MFFKIQRRMKSAFIDALIVGRDMAKSEKAHKSVDIKRIFTVRLTCFFACLACLKNTLVTFQR